MKLTPDLIPHTEFHTGTWLLSVDRPVWYYFRRKKNRNFIHNKSFLKSVDPPLRKLVKWLHSRNIKTTPSCSGHHISERNLREIYQALEKDLEVIQSSGLKLKDIETGKIYFCRDKNYKLPWTEQDFIDQVSVYQQKGIIGLRLGTRKKAKEQIRKMRIEGVTVEENGPVLLILINDGNRGENKETWKKITRTVIGILN